MKLKDVPSSLMPALPARATFQPIARNGSRAMDDGVGDSAARSTGDLIIVGFMQGLRPGIMAVCCSPRRTSSYRSFMAISSAVRHSLP